MSQGPRSARDRLLIGVAEMVELPDWGIRPFPAKVDTGARSSALHVESIERRPGNKVRFEVVTQKGAHRAVCTAPIHRVAEVRSSSGHPEKRVFVVTTLELGEVVKEIEISLTSRHLMRYEMLLGRLALRHDFLIDPGRRYVATRTLRPKKKSKKTKKKRTKGRSDQAEGRR